MNCIIGINVGYKKYCSNNFNDNNKSLLVLLNGYEIKKLMIEIIVSKVILINIVS